MFWERPDSPDKLIYHVVHSRKPGQLIYFQITHPIELTKQASSIINIKELSGDGFFFSFNKISFFN